MQTKPEDEKKKEREEITAGDYMKRHELALLSILVPKWPEETKRFLSREQKKLDK